LFYFAINPSPNIYRVYNWQHFVMLNFLFQFYFLCNVQTKLYLFFL
jgi:hypothetical protein